MPYYQVTRTVLHEEIVKLLMKQIKDGVWKSGEQLPSEMEFAESFGVSRNCIREALKALSFSGIVYSRSGQGTFLSKDIDLRIANYDLVGALTDGSSFYELMETRIIIESQLAGLAAERATDEDIALIFDALNDLKKDLISMVNSGIKNNPTQSGMKFHNTIVNAAKNKLLSCFLASIKGELEAQRSQLLLQYTDIKGMLDDHIHIYEAILHRDPIAAIQAMTSHLEHTYSTMLANKKK